MGKQFPACKEYYGADGIFKQNLRFVFNQAVSSSNPDLPVPVPVNRIQLGIFVGNAVIISEPVKLLAFRVENVNADV